MTLELQDLMQWERRPDDFYATPGEGTQALLDFLGDRLKPGSLILEPSCGEGHISLVLSLAGHEVISFDLRHTGYGIGGQDYLDRDPDGEQDRRFDAVFTNPPFKHAASFIRVALSEAPLVCMLLKMDFWNAEERVALFNEHRPTFILPLAFRLAFAKEERGNSPFMNCMWCVWVEGEPWGEVHILRRPKTFPNVDTVSPIRDLMSAMAEAVDVRC